MITIMNAHTKIHPTTECQSEIVKTNVFASYKNRSVTL